MFASSQLKRRAIRLNMLACAGLTAIAFSAAAAGQADASVTCADAKAKPNQANRQVVTRATLCLINAERRRRGLRPLRPSRHLAVAARQHSRDMVRRSYFSHTTPAGSSFVRRVRRTGYLSTDGAWRVGENIAWGWGEHGSAQAIVRAWMHSPPHRKAILTRSYRDVGIGVATGVPMSLPPGGATFTAEFGMTEK